MKKLGISFAAILLAIFSIAMVPATSAWAADYQVQHTFNAPDGVKTQHNQSVQSNFLAPNVWQTSTTETPPAPGLEMTRNVERYSRTVRHNGRTDYAYCGPKQSNSMDSYADSIVENRDNTTYKAVHTRVVHSNSGAKQPILVESAKGFFRGLGQSIVPWGPVVKITNALTNAPGPTTITGTNTGIVEGTNTGTVTGANTLTGNLTSTSN